MNKDSDINKYKDLDDITINKLSIGLWYVEKRLLLIKLLKYLLIFVSFVSWSYFLYGFGEYIFFGMKEDDKIINQIAQSNTAGHNLLVMKGATGLLLGNPTIIRQNGLNDIVTIVQNPNDKYFASFDFVYQGGDQKLKQASSFVLPADTNYLLAFGQENNFDPQIQLENIRWNRIDPHFIPDWNEFKLAHLNFEVTATEIQRSDDTNRLDSKSINFAEIKFNIKNKTAFNYLNAKFFVILRNGYGISGINEYTIDYFKSGDERKCSINWPDAPSDALVIDVIPNINILDKSVYNKFESGSNNDGGLTNDN